MNDQTNSEDHFKCGFFSVDACKASVKTMSYMLDTQHTESVENPFETAYDTKSFPAAFGILGSEETLETRSQSFNPA